MITFNTIRWKNFLSTGNSFTEISLDNKKSTLIVGQNGAGKSTLLRVIAGDEEIADGKVSWRNGSRHAYLSQDFELDFEGTVKSNVYQGASYQFDLINQYETLSHNDSRVEKIEAEIERVQAWDVDNHYADLSKFLALPGDDREIHNLSGGEKRRVALARTLLGRPDFLILDEPTNHLDIPTIEWLEGYLRNFDGALIIITHDRYFLDRISTGIVELTNGLLYFYEGNYSKFLIQKAERETHLDVLEGKRKQHLKKELEWLRQGVKARGTKSKKRINAYHDEKEKETFKRDDDIDFIMPKARLLGNIVLEAKELSKTIAGKHLFSDVSIEFEEGRNIGIVGQNGLGKSTLLKILIGQLEADSGSVRVGDRTEFNYFDQLKTELDEEKTILEEVAENQEFVSVGDAKITVRGYLKRFLFSDEKINTPVKYLSGGEKSRLLLAKQLKYGGNFLILDEPTNDLDVNTLRALEEALEEYAGCAVIISHDRYFIDRLATHVLAFEGDSKVVWFEGNFSDYMDDKRKRLGDAADVPQRISYKKLKR